MLRVHLFFFLWFFFFFPSKLKSHFALTYVDVLYFLQKQTQNESFGNFHFCQRLKVSVKSCCNTLLHLIMIDFKYQNDDCVFLSHSYPSMIINLGSFDYWNCYCSFADEGGSTADYWACFQMFLMRRSWWNSFALTPTHYDIRFADVRWCGELLDVVPSKGFGDNTM